MIVVVLNGSINSGKTTIGRALAELLPGARFIDGDDHDISRSVPFQVMIDRAILWVARQIAAASEPCLVIAYPLRDSDFALLGETCARRDARLFVVSLAPPLAVALSDRGTRQLDDGERARIGEMYAEGYPTRAFSDVVVTDLAGPQQTAAMLAHRILAP
jgi:hypothetical protein